VEDGSGLPKHCSTLVHILTLLRCSGYVRRCVSQCRRRCHIPFGVGGQLDAGGAAIAKMCKLRPLDERPERKLCFYAVELSRVSGPPSVNQSGKVMERLSRTYSLCHSMIFDSRQ
jgi:hypothetical protein